MAKLSVMISSVLHCSLLIISLLCCGILCHQESGMTIEVGDKDRFCFYEDFDGSGKMILEYKVIKGGNLDINVAIDSPNGKKLYSAERKRGDVVTFETSVGTYMICFGNEFSTITHKFVYFDLRSAGGSKSQLAHEVEGINVVPKVNTRAEDSLESVHRYGSQVMQYQVQYRQNEARGRYRAEVLNQHVLWWPMAQSIAILISGLGQLFVLKWFFSDKRKLTPAGAASLLLDSGSHDKTMLQTPPAASLPLRP